MFNETLLLLSSSLSRINVPALLTFSRSRVKTKSNPLSDCCPELLLFSDVKFVASGFSSTNEFILVIPFCNKECS